MCIKNVPLYSTVKHIRNMVNLLDVCAVAVEVPVDRISVGQVEWPPIVRVSTRDMQL